jgi:transketolase
MAGELPADWQEKAGAYVKQTVEKAEKVASRKASQNAINGFGPRCPSCWAAPPTWPVPT